MKPGHVVAAVLAAGFLLLGLFVFRQTLTPYVGIEEARLTATPVQVAGKVVAGSVSYSDSGALQFRIHDGKSHELAVEYPKPKPAGFEDADSVVVAGAMQGEVFRATQLLVKCPSKYEGKVSE